MKCSACWKEIDGNGVLISCDGDFVCDEKCKKLFYEKMDMVCNMSDIDFERWLTGEEHE